MSQEEVKKILELVDEHDKHHKSTVKWWIERICQLYTKPDRPELREIAMIAKCGKAFKCIDDTACYVCPEALTKAKEILTLIEEAKREERERIEKWFRDHGIGFWYSLTGGKPGSFVQPRRVWQALKGEK